jgi:outer membrane protein assembly factor BamB
MRRALRLLLALPFLAACSTLDSLNPFASSPRVKPAELTPIQASAEIRRLWQAETGSAGDYTLVPAVVGTAVYAAARNGSLARFEGGREVWRIDAGQTVSGGVGADAKMVVVGTPKGEVLAFDANGKALWQSRVSSEVLAPPLVAESQVLVRSGDNRVYALDVLDGKRRWVYQRSTPPLSLRAPVGVVVADGKVLAGFPGGKLVAISLTNGAALWEATVALPRGATELERVADVSSTPVVSGRAVCAVAFQGRAACFDIGNGNSLWSRELSSDVGLAADERTVYVTDDKGAVHAFDRTNGASLWKQDKLLMRGVTRPLPVGRHVMVADGQGVVHLLKREDGSFAARFTADGSGIAAPPQAYESGGLIQTRGGGLFALSTQ